MKSEEKKIEEVLPQALYQISSLITFSDYEEAIKTIAEGKYGVLSEKLKKVCIRMNNIGFEKALMELKKETNSNNLETVIEILLTGYETGEDISSSLVKTADSIMSKTLMEKQQAATTIVQKYTILLSSALIVPLLLGITISLAFAVNTSGLFNISEAAKGSLLSIAITADYVYIVINSLISSIFLTRISNESNLLKYLPIVIISLLVFTLGKSIKVL